MKRSGLTTHSDGGGDDQVDVKELSVSKICLVAVQNEDRCKLDHGVEGHVLEHTKGGDQRTPDNANEDPEKCRRCITCPP